jgi:hypothetical protein
MSQHTPGPWTRRSNDVIGGDDYIDGLDGNAVVRLLREAAVLLKQVACSRTLHMDGLPKVKGCPGCDARALLARIKR